MANAIKIRLAAAKIIPCGYVFLSQWIYREKEEKSYSQACHRMHGGDQKIQNNNAQDDIVKWKNLETKAETSP